MNVLSLVATVASAFVVTFATVVIPSPSTVAASRYAVRRGTRAAAVFLGAVLCLDVAVFLVLAFGFHRSSTPSARRSTWRRWSAPG